MTDKLIPVLDGAANKRLKDMGDGTFAEVVAVVGGAGVGSTSAKEVLVTSYNVITTFAGGSPGDLVTLTQIFDFSTSPPVVTSIWKNETLGTTLGAAPPNNHLALLGTANSGLTDTQLRASPVVVNINTMPLPPNAAADSTLALVMNNVGFRSDDPYTSPLASASIISFLKGGLKNWENIGLQTDVAATSDTGNFTFFAFIKRAMQNWTTLLGRIPAVGQKTAAASIPVVIASNQGNLPVQVNGTVAVSHQLTTNQVSMNILRTTGNQVISNARSFSLQNLGGNNAVVNGQIVGPGEKVEFRAPDGYVFQPFNTGGNDGTTVLMTWVS
jgi:hypothetical protein